MANQTIMLDPETKDISFINGDVVIIDESATVLQNIRNVLLVYRGEFEKDKEHGTDYDSIFSGEDVTDEEVVEIIRDAIFQEPYVQELSEISVSRSNRQLSVAFVANLYTGETITARVVI